MARNPGKIIKLADGRICILYDRQELFESKGIVILHRVDEKFNQMFHENGKPLIIIWNRLVFNHEVKTATLIGYVD